MHAAPSATASNDHEPLAAFVSGARDIFRNVDRVMTDGLCGRFNRFAGRRRCVTGFVRGLLETVRDDDSCFLRSTDGHIFCFVGDVDGNVFHLTGCIFDLLRNLSVCRPVRKQDDREQYCNA